MSVLESAGRGLGRWLARTPNRTFLFYPLLVVAGRLLTRPATRPRLRLAFVPLLAWGYLEYRLVGGFRIGRGGGGPGITIPPDRLVIEGPYRYTRNPMYLGHLIFLFGLALTFRSRLAAALLVGNAAWFHRRVVDDEARLVARFGAEYEAYRRQVPRWLPRPSSLLRPPAATSAAPPAAGPADYSSSGTAGSQS